MDLKLLVVLASNVYFVIAESNNVCKTVPAYLFKTYDCWYDRDLDLDVTDIISRHGYPVTVYTVTTMDGYILKVIRIPNNGQNPDTIRQPVFLQHGMLQNSAIWVDIANNSLAFVLSNLGYDVWMGNTRGTSLSNEHIQFNQDDRQYWEYTLDSFGHYDTAAVMDFIRNTTKQKIIYIGHSQGTTQSYIYAIDNQTLAENNLKGLVSLAPVAYLDGLPVLQYVSPLAEPILNLLYASGIYYIGMGQDENRKLLDLLCLTTPIQINVCKFLLQRAYGYDAGNQWSPELLPAMIRYLSDRESFLPMIHFLQISNSKKFQAFDFGREQNLELYGQENPKEYDLSQIRLPVYLFYGMNDLLGYYKNVYRLYADLKTKKQLIPIGGRKYAFNHNHFVYSNRVVEEFYRKLLPIIDELKRL